MSRIVDTLETNGIFFDWDAYATELLSNKQNDFNRTTQALASLLHCPTYRVIESKKVIWELYKNNLYPESLSLEYLKAHRNDNPIYEQLYHLRRLHQFLAQYGEKLRTYRSPDGRIHAKWKLNGAKTGRMTCSEPNLQAFPNEIKPYFRAEDGNCLISGDYSQIELRMLAELSGDQHLRRCFKKGMDIHRQTAATIYNIPLDKVSDEQRAIAKKVNFGLCYGISANGLSDLLTNKAGVPTTLKEANSLRTAFYKAYPQVLSYHNSLLTAKTITSLGGQEWRDYPSGVARINLPVQASAAEGLKEALQLLLDNAPSEAKLVNVVHDEIVVEAPMDIAESTRKLLEECMIDGMRRLGCTVPITVDTNIK